MRLGVLDIGSNTGHLLVVDAHLGAAPLPAYSYKEPLRLAEHLDETGAVSQQGIDALAAFTTQAIRVADIECGHDTQDACSALRDHEAWSRDQEHRRAEYGQPQLLDQLGSGQAHKIALQEAGFTATAVSSRSRGMKKEPAKKQRPLSR